MQSDSGNYIENSHDTCFGIGVCALEIFLCNLTLLL